MNPGAEELKARTRRFALEVIALSRTFDKTPEADVVRRQLVKAACGVAGNYRHACRARSHAEFTAKIGVVLEEADESELWLGTTRDARFSQSPELPRLFQESRELMAIFSQANRTARSTRKGL
jgi:four helix bundle protein